MHIENQCCTKEQAQQLYELGVFGDTLFYHTNSDWGILPRMSVDFKNGHVLNAFLGTELGHILSSVRYKAYGYSLIFTSSYNEDEDANLFGMWSCGCRNPVDFSNPDIKADTEAQAKADLLIFLVKNKIVTAEHCNNALKHK